MTVDPFAVPFEEPGDASLDAELTAMLDELTEGAGPDADASLAPPPDDVPSTRVLLCTVAGRRAAIPIANVAEVGRVPAVMPLPFVPAWIVGVINLRGEIVSLVDLAMLLTGRPTPAAASRMVVVQPEHGRVFGAALVDAVHGTRDVPLANLAAPAGAIAARFRDFVSATWFDTGDRSHPDGGDTDLAVPVLDLERLITSEHVQVSETA